MDYEQQIKNLFNINEINRLHRCAKNKDKKEIIKWGQEFESYVAQKYHDYYENKFIEWIKDTTKDLDIAIIYALHFNQNTRFGMKRLQDFMTDLRVTVKGFYEDKFDRQEYIEMLQNDGIKVMNINNGGIK